MLTREERNNISHSLKASELRHTCNIEITMRRSPVRATLRGFRQCEGGSYFEQGFPTLTWQFLIKLVKPSRLIPVTLSFS